MNSSNLINRRYSQITRKKLKFALFVNHLFRQITPQLIQSFRLHSTHELVDHSHLNPFHIHLWIKNIAPTVQQLDLAISLMETNAMELKMDLFRFNKLVVLKLRGIYFIIPAQASVCFPNLQTLHLFDVTFSIAGDSSVSFPNLKILHFHNVRDEIDGSANRMLSSCPVLHHLDINIRHGSDIRYLVLPSLTSLTLNSWGSYDYLYQIQMDKLRKLKFLSTSYDALTYIMNMSTYNSWGFGYLKRLELEMCECSGFSLVTNMLESMVNLEHLVLQKQCHDYCSCSGTSYWTEPLNVPKCLLSRVTTISITPAMDSCTNQLELVRYFLMNARVLQLLRLDTKFCRPKRKLIFIEKVSMFPKESQTCQVEFTAKRLRY